MASVGARTARSVAAAEPSVTGPTAVPTTPVASLTTLLQLVGAPASEAGLLPASTNGCGVRAKPPEGGETRPATRLNAGMASASASP